MGLRLLVGQLMNEWAGTPWGGTDPVARPMKVKAATGWEPIYNPYNTVLSQSRSPLKRMREEQALYRDHEWIGSAEDTVTDRVASLPWHVEDGNDDTVDDEEKNPQLKAIRTLLEKPQAALPEDERQSGYETWENLVSVTSRHAGLCGVSYWFLDQTDTYGIPAAILYVNPARLYPVTTAQGRLLGYVLDPKDEQGRGGTTLRRNQIIPFYLKPPDFGSLPTGLVHRAIRKARLTVAADNHAMSTLATGGRIAGLISPKEGYIDDPDRWGQLEKDIRNVTDAEDSARRAAIVRGPVEFHNTASNPKDLQLLDLARMESEDIFVIWDIVPTLKRGGASGLNSGETRKHEYQALMQGPVHNRVNMIRTTVQMKLLDRWNAVGLSPQLVIEEPSFDDKQAPYELAAKAKDQPLTVNERRDLVGLDPLPEYGPDGEPLGLAIVLPFNLSTFGQGPEEGSSDNNPFPGALRVVKVPPPQLGPGVLTPPGATMKASPARGFVSLRKTLEAKTIPAVRQTMAQVLAAQRASVVAKVRARGAALAKKPDVWDEPGENARLTKALRPHIAGIADLVTVRAKSLFEAKADPFTDAVEDELLTRTGARITGINDTTRQAVIAAIRDGFAASLTVNEIADRIEALPAFDEARAEMVARTESGYAYNYAAVSSYREYGVERVEVIDGDEDDPCAQANGSTWTLEEANENPLGHPNCTRDFAPVAA